MSVIRGTKKRQSTQVKCGTGSSEELLGALGRFTNWVGWVGAQVRKVYSSCEKEKGGKAKWKKGNKEWFHLTPKTSGKHWATIK